MVRKLEERLKETEVLNETISKHFLVDNQIQQYNAAFETLSKVLKGEDLGRLCDFMKEKQDEFGKKKNNVSIMTRKDSKVAVQKHF